MNRGGLPKDLLNEPQRRRLSLTLAAIEKKLRTAQIMAGAGDYKGVLYELRNDIPVEACLLLGEKISEIREKIKAIAGMFSLEKKEEALLPGIDAELSIEQVWIEEIKSKRLRGYGEVAAGLPDVLDPVLDELSALLLEAQRVLKK
jgi:hypothetical protein